VGSGFERWSVNFVVVLRAPNELAELIRQMDYFRLARPMRLVGKALNSAFAECADNTLENVRWQR